jgi:hypothetical protein
MTKQRDSYSTRELWERSTSTEGQWRPGISESELRRLPFGVAVMLEADMRTAVVDVVPYWQRAEHAACISASQQWFADHPGLVLASAVVPLGTGQYTGTDGADDDGHGGGGDARAAAWAAG